MIKEIKVIWKKYVFTESHLCSVCNNVIHFYAHLRTSHVASLRSCWLLTHIRRVNWGHRQSQEVHSQVQNGQWSAEPLTHVPRLCGGWLPTTASLVELASTRGLLTNMKATRTKHSLLRVCVLSCFIYLLCSTCAGVVAGRKMASHHPTLKRSRRSHQSAKHKGAHHRPLTDEQKADQNLQFMLSLYRSAAEPDGRPKQHRKFGSNTVRLLRPSASSVHYLPASRGEGDTLLSSMSVSVAHTHQPVLPVIWGQGSAFLWLERFYLSSVISYSAPYCIFKIPPNQVDLCNISGEIMEVEYFAEQPLNNRIADFFLKIIIILFSNCYCTYVVIVHDTFTFITFIDSSQWWY